MVKILLIHFHHLLKNGFVLSNLIMISLKRQVLKF